jgi:hypothetical protein
MHGLDLLNSHREGPLNSVANHTTPPFCLAESILPPHIPQIIQLLEDTETMSEDHSGQVTKKETPSDFFEAIGDKVSSLNQTTNGDVANDNDDRPPVEEIESLCMNCGENVSGPPLPPS